MLFGFQQPGGCHMPCQLPGPMQGSLLLCQAEAVNKVVRMTTLVLTLVS